MSYDDCCYAIKDSGGYPYGTLARRETVDVLFRRFQGRHDSSGVPTLSARIPPHKRGVVIHGATRALPLCIFS